MSDNRLGQGVEIGIELEPILRQKGHQSIVDVLLKTSSALQLFVHILRHQQVLHLVNGVEKGARCVIAAQPSLDVVGVPLDDRKKVNDKIMKERIRNEGFTFTNYVRESLILTRTLLPADDRSILPTFKWTKD